MNAPTATPNIRHVPAESLERLREAVREVDIAAYDRVSDRAVRAQAELLEAARELLEGRG